MTNLFKWYPPLLVKVRQWENGYSTFIDEETGYEIRFSQWYGHASMADVY